MELLGKVAMVTGSTSGIGLGVARALAKRGSSIVITGLGDQKVIDRLVDELKCIHEENVPKNTKNHCHALKTSYLTCDLRNKLSIHDFCKQVFNIHPEGLDILVNNAGIQHVAPIDEYPDDKWEDMISITVSAPFHLIKYFLPGMKQKGWGRIVNISSMMGVISQRGKAPYSASKSAVNGLTRGVALDAAPYGVTCNAICPAFVYTPLISQQIETFRKEENISYEEAKKSFFLKHPTQKPIEVEQVADLVLYLCSDAAQNITGSSMVIDGGFTVA